MLNFSCDEEFTMVAHVMGSRVVECLLRKDRNAKHPGRVATPQSRP